MATRSSPRAASSPVVASEAVTGARRLLALIAIASVVLASIFSGRSYLWCIEMQQVELVCYDGDEEQTDGPSVDEDCCEELAIGKLPRGERKDAPTSIPPALLAIRPSAPPAAIASPLPAPHLASSARTSTRATPARAGPASASERCAVLQVFHC